MKNGRCPDHARAQRREAERTKNPVSVGLYKTARWRAIRAAHLAREPLCRACAAVGIVTPADTVDHVTPHRGDVVLFFDPANLQSLDASCHSSKTAREVFHGETVGAAGPPPPAESGPPPNFEF